MTDSGSRLSALDRLAAVLYRTFGGRVPYLVLKRLGIATPRRRVEFYTLATLVGRVPASAGVVLECGTYRGATLLGMTHLLRRRGLKPRVYGLDSFEGFPDPAPQDAQSDGRMHPDVHRGALADAS